MAKRPDVIPGEATESESEEEINQHDTDSLIAHSQQKSPTTPHGIVVAGEAPESDEDELNLESTPSVIDSPTPNIKQKLSVKVNKYNELQHTSLLHRKLHERSVWLKKHINEFIHHSIRAPSEKLNAANQRLLHSQVQLQETCIALQTLQSQTVQINDMIRSVLSDSSIPEIKLVN